LQTEGVQDLDLTFAKQKVPIAGYSQDECWQVIGRWQKVFNTNSISIFLKKISKDKELFLQ
jgi:hypothetical protein